ncbi:MAG: hypothetical protein ACFFDB_06910 [Promethearchaeota archaeon]
MLKKIRKGSNFFSKTILVIFLVGLVLIPVFFNISKIHSLKKIDGEELSISDYRREDYKPILSTDIYGLGSVTINNMHFNYYVIGNINHSTNHPLIDEDITSNALKIGIEKIDYLGTTQSAISDNLNHTKQVQIYVKLNETLKVEYNNTMAGYLIYLSRFSLAKLLDFYVEYDSMIVRLTEGIDYTIDEIGYVIFNYETYFQKGPIFSFKIHFIYEFGFAIGDWTLDQREETPLVMSEKEQDFSSRFTYQFYLIGWAVTFDLSGTVPIDYIDLALTITPPDKDQLSYQELIVNTLFKNVNDYVNPNKTLSIEISDLFKPNRSFISLNFTCDFGLKFEEPVGNSWAIDRLVNGRNIRERTYIISMVTGPPHIFLKNISLYETNINIEQVTKASSLFNREVEYFDANQSFPRQLGLMMKIPYLIVGETCPFSIQYIVSETLNIIVTDSIKMPLVGVNIEILFWGAKFGTYISNISTQPISPGLTNGNGQVILYDVPRGNYTARVIWQGAVVKESTITTDKEVNYIFTNVPHFPLWIMIFGMISGIILVFGALFYIKYKKVR